MTLLVALVSMAALAPAGEGNREDAVRKLETLKVTVDFQDVKLGEAIDYLRDVTGLNLVLLPRAAEKGEFKVRLKVRELTVKSTLKLMLSGHGLSVTWRDGAVVVLPQEDLQDEVTFQMYDVRAQLVKLSDFPGPKVELVRPGRGATTGPIVGIEQFELHDPPVAPEFLVDLVKANTGGQSWDQNRNASIQLTNGMLVVSQTGPVHREIKTLLGLLAQYR
jgi:hypothetical protein